MPRDGSPAIPPGAVPAAPMDIGEVANPPFAVLPKPELLFKGRAERLASLASGHQLGPYLRFLSDLSAAQNDVLAELPQPQLPSRERLEIARGNGMPPLSVGQIEPGAALDRTLTTLLRQLEQRELNAATRDALEHLANATADERAAAMRAVLFDQIPADEIAAHVLAAAALQVYLSRLAAQLDPGTLTRITDAACPACGGAPVSSSIVGWEGAHGTRFCTCSLCATQWHVPRIRCLVCGSEKGIAYHSIDGGDDKIMGETCESCSSYVKLLHQHKEPSLEPMADDIASLGLDMTLEREGWRRASANPFLMGY